MKLILGIDPGSKTTGYGLIVCNPDGRLTCRAAGIVKPPAKWPLHKRLEAVFDGLTEVISQSKPDEVAVEDIFYARNVKSAIALGHVRGVAMLAAAKAGLDVTIYAPASIKKAVSGYGRATKDQVSRMVCSILGITEDLPDDATDALACAICHYHTSSYMSRIAGGNIQ